MSFRTKPAELAITSATAALLLLAANSASAATYAPWLTQIGITDAIESAAAWGKGQLLGVVDTGIVANSSVFASGQVSSALSACAAVSFKCRNGFVDDESHGTAVASIAVANRTAPGRFVAGGYVVASGSVIGVAPNANIFSEKVLNAQGLGYGADLVSGIRKAAEAGASVINLSISYGNTAELVSAINYAAGKGAFLVWAGGNEAKILLGGASTSGLSTTAINHLLLVGSVSSSNKLSNFSNTPGSGLLVDTGNARSAYSTRWIMAPGEAIVAPMVTAGSNAWAAWSGTSMSAPLISGSLLLLQAAWPILKTNGTAANLLLATASDLGVKGVDATYGNGIVNLGAAFRPYGTLSVTQTDGKSVPVGNLTGSLISGGALGNLATLQAKLVSYTSFDTYARNFSVNLSGLLIKPTPLAVSTNPLPSNPNRGPTIMKFADGAELAYLPPSSVASLTDKLGEFGYNSQGYQSKRLAYAMLTDRSGATTAVGYGYPTHFSYARALYGDADFAWQSAELGVAGLAALAQGGAMLVYGRPLSENARFAVSWSGTSPYSPEGSRLPPAWNAPWTTPSASSMSLGLSRKFNATFTGGLVFGVLREKHGFLGSTYDSGSLVSLGDDNRTYSYGLSAAVSLDQTSSLLFETTYASSRNAAASGLLTGTSAVAARAHGLTLMSKSLLKADDRLTASIKQPLSMVSGRAAVIMPSVDAEGLAHFNTEWVDIVPDGREVDYLLSYAAPLRRDQTLSIVAGYRKDIQNIAGSSEARLGMSWSMKF